MLAGTEDFSQSEKPDHTACLPSGDFYSQVVIIKFPLDSVEEFELQNVEGRDRFSPRLLRGEDEAQ